MGQSPKRLSGEVRRELILDAAEQLLARKGYAQTTLIEIAELAGVSKALVYHYYPEGRVLLFREVIERLGAGIDEALGPAERSGSARHELFEYVDRLLTFFDEHPFGHRLLELEPWGTGDAGVIGSAVGVHMRLVSRLAGILEPSDHSVERVTSAAKVVVGALLQVVEMLTSEVLELTDAQDLAKGLLADGLSGIRLI